MQVKSAIILSAGKGTRMGKIGELLAKPVWPFFGTTLIELHIKFLSKRFGIKNFYINSHHLYEQLNFLQNKEIQVIYEPMLLDQGGGILNILDKFDLWDEPLLISNSDQLFFFDQKFFEEAKTKLAASDAVLFGLNVKTSDGYNKLLIDKDKLKGIEKNSNLDEESFMTFSGISLIKHSKESYNGEVVSYFDSVADYKNKKVLVQKTESRSYFDFGKLISFYRLCMETKVVFESGESNPITDLLPSVSQQYAKSDYGLNFSSVSNIDVPKNEILLDSGRVYLENGVIKDEVRS